MTACRNISSGDLPVGPHPDTHSHSTRSLGALGVSGAAGPQQRRLRVVPRIQRGGRAPWAAGIAGLGRSRGLQSPVSCLCCSSPAPCTGRALGQGRRDGRSRFGRVGFAFPRVKSPTPELPLREFLRGWVTQKAEHREVWMDTQAPSEVFTAGILEDFKC